MPIFDVSFEVQKLKLCGMLAFSAWTTLIISTEFRLWQLLVYWSTVKSNCFVEMSSFNFKWPSIYEKKKTFFPYWKWQPVNWKTQNGSYKISALNFLTNLRQKLCTSGPRRPWLCNRESHIPTDKQLNTEQTHSVTCLLKTCTGPCC